MVEPTRRSTGDPSRLNHSASLRSALRFGRSTPGIPPSRALSAGPPPGELAGAPCPRDSAQIGDTVAAVRLAGRSVVGAGFALPRDAGRRPGYAVRSSEMGGARRSRASGEAPTGRTGRRSMSPRFCAGGVLPSAQKQWQRTPFAARVIGGKVSWRPATRRHGNADLWSAQPRGSAAGETNLKQRDGPYSNGYFSRSGGAGAGHPASWQYVVRPPPAGCADQRSAFPEPSPRSTQIGDTPFAAVRLAGRSVVGAGFALPRDAGRRPALPGVRRRLGAVASRGGGQPRAGTRRRHTTAAQPAAPARMSGQSSQDHEGGAPPEIAQARANSE